MSIDSETIDADLLTNAQTTEAMQSEELDTEETHDLTSGLDWETLQKTELHEQQDPSHLPLDDSFLRQRLLHELGDASQSDQGSKRSSIVHSHSRRESLQQIRRSVVDSATIGPNENSNVRHSQAHGHLRSDSKEILLTDLELWTALVSDYPQTAIRLPTLTSRKIRAGVPQPLRGLVWQAMSGARDTHLEGLYETLSVESTPFEKVIGRDLARTFPQVEMFKEEGGAGQLDLGKVLRAFSLYDADVGYCQGLGFIVAPLLMNMTHCEAFCVLVRMMEGYGLRDMFTQTLSGLKLRLFQFEQILNRVAPGIAEHLRKIDVFPAMYVSQWFLSLFAVTCPLETLHRVYDLMLAEGAPETMMRLAITLLVKSQEQIMEMEMEEVLHLLLSSDLWSGYDGEDDLLINDVVSFTTTITGEHLSILQKQFESGKDIERPGRQVKSLQSITSSFLGRMNPTRLFSGSFAAPPISMQEQNSPDMARTSSKMSHSSVHSSITENPEDSSNSSFSRSSVMSLKKQTESLERDNRQLNQQIEDLIEALGESHRSAAKLQEEHDRRIVVLDEVRATAEELLKVMKQLANDPELDNTDNSNRKTSVTHWAGQLSSVLSREPSSITSQISVEKIAFLESQLDDRNHEAGRMRLSLQSVKAALEATQREKSRLERALSEARQRKEPGQNSGDVSIRELRLGKSTSRAPSQSRADSAQQTAAPKIFRRASTFAATINSASTSPVLPSSPDLGTTGEVATNSPKMTAHEEEVDSLRLELVQAKAAIAIAQQEAEEAKYALRMFRNAQPKGHAKRVSITRAETAPATPVVVQETANVVPKAAATPVAGNWFWKR